MQAVNAVNTLNGADLHGRKMMVREDREDRDVKQYNQENGLRSPKARGRGRGPRGGGASRPRNAEGAEAEAVSSGLQVQLSFSAQYARIAQTLTGWGLHRLWCKASPGSTTGRS